MKKVVYISQNIESYKETALVFAPNFFRIHASLVDGFEKNGLGVYLFLDKPSNTAWFKSKLRLKPQLVSKKMKKYLEEDVNSFFFDKKMPTYVVVFEGQAFLESHTILLKTLFPQSKLIIYCWDSIERFPYIEQNLKHYHKKITFSYDNFIKYKFDKFVPLFIPKDFYDSPFFVSSNTTYDLCFIGTGHPPKVSFLSDVECFAKNNNLSFFESIYLPTKTLFWYYKATSKAFRKKKIRNFTFKSKDAKEIQQLYSKTKAVVDAGNPNESGVSLRIFECISMQKKVVLANKSITKYPFYHPDRFLIFPEESSRLLSFLSSPYPEMSKEELERLSVKQFINNIIF